MQCNQAQKQLAKDFIKKKQTLLTYCRWWMICERITEIKRCCVLDRNVATVAPNKQQAKNTPPTHTSKPTAAPTKIVFNFLYNIFPPSWKMFRSTAALLLHILGIKYKMWNIRVHTSQHLSCWCNRIYTRKRIHSTRIWT